jgi:transposase
MATVCAARCNPVLRAFYQRLRDAGKLAALALTAVILKGAVGFDHELHKYHG